MFSTLSIDEDMTWKLNTFTFMRVVFTEEPTHPANTIVKNMGNLTLPLSIGRPLLTARSLFIFQSLSRPGPLLLWGGWANKLCRAAEYISGQGRSRRLHNTENSGRPWETLGTTMSREQISATLEPSWSIVGKNEIEISALHRPVSNWPMSQH